MRIVITGGSGRIGRWVVRELLARDHEITIFDRVPPSEQPAGVRYKLGECEDLGAVYDVLRGHDAVIHLAAIPSNQVHPYPTVFRTNVISTYHVAEAAGRLGMKKLVAASSINALGITMAERPFNPTYLPIDEEHPRLAQDAYSLTKLLDEEILAAMTRRTGLPTIGIRPPLMQYGEPEKERETVRARVDNPDLASRVMWVYCDVRDLAQGFRLAVEDTTLENETFFITADDALARQPLADLLPRYFPGTEEMAKGLTGTSPAVVSTKAKRLLGYRPEHSWQEYV
ncbi:MAG: NAD(P)-dependent oxidoreductase [Chloroflexi bacterium]|nr:NAD(P)-dependent oxidoreductase [Chloroflexota bacterium]